MPNPALLNAEDVIRFEAVSKVFGGQQQRALALLQQGATNQEIKQETGSQVALRQISLDIRRGEIFSIMGLSGSGKSTLVRFINRLLQPELGQVWVNQQCIKQLSDSELRVLRQQQVSMVFQNFGLFPHLNVLENAEFALRTKGLSKFERSGKARHWLTEVGLEGYEYAAITELSGGMQQRVGLARALAAETDILVMDEPFSALDPITRHRLQLLLIDLRQQYQKTIVFVTHDVDEAIQLGGRVALMHDAELIQTGYIHEMIDAPVNGYVSEFLKVRSSV